nr:hypothetical protein [Flavobacterium sp.]
MLKSFIFCWFAFIALCCSLSGTVNDSFLIATTDVEGDVATGTLAINILDDVPPAQSIIPTVNIAPAKGWNVGDIPVAALGADQLCNVLP